MQAAECPALTCRNSVAAMLRDILLWVVAVQCAGLAVLPLSVRLFRTLPDRGYALAKPLGLLAVTYLIWLLGMLGYLAYSRPTCLAVLVLVGSVCWMRWGAPCLDWLRTRPAVIAIEEAIFLVAALVAAYVRSFNADIIGQEKFMDLAFFNGFLRSPGLPAEDTWLAGYGMPYYPFGYLLLSVPAKLAGLPAAYGYNLALILVFALTFVLAAALVADLVNLLGGAERSDRRLGASAWGFGLLGATLVLVCGNLVGPLEIMAARGVGSPEFWSTMAVKNLGPASDPTSWLPRDGGWWWHASRVIPTIQPDGITEFPYFSFLLGDLHPHFTALPLLLLICALSLALLLESRPWEGLDTILPTALIMGVPLVANTWDLATSWLLYGLVAALVARRVVARGEGLARWPLARALVPLPLGLALFSPYFIGYASQPLGIGFVIEHGSIRTDSTPLVSLLLIFGPFLLLAALFALRLLACAGPAARHTHLSLVASGLLLVAILSAAGLVVAAFSLALLVLVALAGLRQLRAWLAADSNDAHAAAVYLLALTSLALTILVTVELVYIRDSFGTRMNTVFKFYYHVWLLLGLVGAPALAVWMGASRLGSVSVIRRGLATVVAVLVLAPGLVYPLAATWTKSNGLHGPATLDGAAFLDRAKPGDAEAIRWLSAQPKRQVVLEAIGGDYQEFARVSTFSGLPTVLGWVGHELQWRGQLDEFGRRQRDVEAIYQRAEPAEALRILNLYRVRYVFVGSLEREKYGPQVEERLAHWLTPAFRRERTTVFAVPSGEEAS